MKFVDIWWWSFQHFLLDVVYDMGRTSCEKAGIEFILIPNKQNNNTETVMKMFVV